MICELYRLNFRRYGFSLLTYCGVDGDYDKCDHYHLTIFFLDNVGSLNQDIFSFFLSVFELISSTCIKNT